LIHERNGSLLGHESTSPLQGSLTTITHRRVGWSLINHSGSDSSLTNHLKTGANWTEIRPGVPLATVHPGFRDYEGLASMAQHRQNHQRRGDRQSAASQYGDIYQQVNERVMAALEAGAPMPRR